MAKKKQKTTRKTVRTGRQNKVEQQQDEELKQWITIVVLSAIAIIGYMQMGVVGFVLSNIQKFLFGKYYFVIIAVIVIQIFITIVNHRTGKSSSKNPIAIVLIIVGILLWAALSDVDRSLKGDEILFAYLRSIDFNFIQVPVPNVGGGFIGAALLSITTLLVDYTGTMLIIAVLFLIAALLLVSLSTYKQAFTTIKDYFSTVIEYVDDEDEDEEYEEIVEEIPEETVPLQTITQPEPVTLTKDSFAIDTTTELTSSQLLQEEDKIPIPLVPTSPLDIRVDQDEPMEDSYEFGSREEVPQQPRSIFMNVDDLQDRVGATAGPLPTPSQEIYEDEDDEDIEAYEPVIAKPKAVVEENPYEGMPEPKTIKPSKNAYRGYRPAGMAQLDEPRTEDSRTNESNIQYAKEKALLLLNVLNDFDISAELLETHIGPSVTKYEIKPAVGVKVSKILSLADDIKMRLAVKDVRIEAPIPGHYAVGVEIPNLYATPVKLKELFKTTTKKEKEEPLLFFLGKDLLGKTVTCRLDKMPHMLIAGATGSGKSVCMNSIITSFLLLTRPDQVKLLLVDPKKVEFTPYKNIPHLIGPVINDAAKANLALKVIVKIMDERYELFSQEGVRNIQVYNEKIEKGLITRKGPEGEDIVRDKLPYIVVIIDELADLMMVAGKEVEASIQRITQLARAAGIHLIVATQRPSTDVITGIIKANIPSRIAFSVSSGIDSRTILDHVGAERLLGNGDMLYMPIGESNAIRVQGVFVTDDEVARVTQFVSEQAVPMYDDAFVNLDGAIGNMGAGLAEPSDDPMYEQIKNFVIDQQKASTSLLQRYFSIGYNRAARMIDQLESDGIIGPAQGSKPREVYIKKDNSTED